LYDTHSDHIHVNNIIKAVLEECSEFRIFCDEVTEEMILEIKAAQKLGIQIKFYDADMREINYDALIINKKIGPGYKKIIAESHGDSYAGTVCPYAAECAKAGGAETSVPMEPAAAPSESSTEAEPAEEEKNSIGRRIQKWMEIFFTTV